MDTQAKKGGYHKTLTCSRVATMSTSEDEASMGTEGKWIYTGTVRWGVLGWAPLVAEW